ncbi:MAG: STAS domain-containing protein [Phycisphaeraceae bacterium]
MNDEEVLRSTQPIADGILVTLEGDIDLSRTPELRHALLEVAGEKPPRLVVDLTGVDYMDSSGVATLVEALQHQRRHAGKMVLFGLSAKVKSIFEIARLDMVFTIVADADAALTA